MPYKTLRYRIKDESASRHLNKMAFAVNSIWNYCNEVNMEYWTKFGRTYTKYDLHKKTAGCTKYLGLRSNTVEAVCDEFVTRRTQFKKIKMSWRGRRSLGWIPFKRNLSFKGDSFEYYGHVFRIWLSRPINSAIKCGSFSQNAKGDWFVNLTVDDSERSRLRTGRAVGIDLGLKSIATLSNGIELTRKNVYQEFAIKLATAQRAKKKNLVRAIYTKIANKRRDWNQKQTTQLVREYDTIAIGNISGLKLKNTLMTKSVSDAAWSDFKRMLAYKAIALGVDYKEVNESFSTVTCSTCGSRTGPKGLNGLGVREWICSSCGESHRRDVNAAMNILNSAQGIERRRESIKLEGVNTSLSTYLE